MKIYDDEKMMELSIKAHSGYDYKKTYYIANLTDKEYEKLLLDRQLHFFSGKIRWNHAIKKELPMEEPKIRHLEMIQEVISRMANNSFALKGWTVTLAAGIFALSGDAIGTNFWFLFLPIIIFLGLDTFYLSKERSYRSLLSTWPG